MKPLRLSRLSLGALLMVALGILPGHAQKTAQAKAISRRVMCMCGCGQVLGECNHVNCPMSGPMLKDLDRQVAAGSSDDLIVQGFVQQFGEKVLAEPPARGFNLLAWLMPIFVTVTGFAVVRIVLLRWRHPAIAGPSTAAGLAPAPEILERVRRESGQDG